MNKILFLFLIILGLGSCAVTYNYLPDAETVSDSPYGSYIRLKTNSGTIIKGELIAVQNDTLVIGSLRESMLYYTNMNVVEEYYIQFCDTRKFAILPVVSVSHGLWMIFTVPLNALISTSLGIAEMKDSRLTNLEFEEFHLFARYPQGLPPGFSARNFKPVKPSKR